MSCLAGPLPLPNHPFEGTLGVVGQGERAGQAKLIAEAISAPDSYAFRAISPPSTGIVAPVI